MMTGHTVCLAGHGLNEALQVGEVVIGGQVVLIVEQLVGSRCSCRGQPR